MHQNISIKVFLDNQVQLPQITMNDSRIDHLSDPSPLNLPQISRKMGLSIYIGCETEVRLKKYKP